MSKGENYAAAKKPGLQKLSTMVLNEKTGFALKRGDSLSVNFNERVKSQVSISPATRSVQKRREEIFA